MTRRAITTSILLLTVLALIASSALSSVIGVP